MDESSPSIQPESSGPPPIEQADDKVVAMLAWLLCLFIPVIPALIIYLISNDDPTSGQRSFSKESARVALNWQLTNILAVVVGIVLTIVVIGLVIIGVFSVLNIVFCIIGTVKTLQGQSWKSPMTINFLK